MAGRGDVAQGPLLSLRGAGRPAADEEQRAEAVAPVQGAVAAAAGVGDAAPVDRLVAGRQGDDDVARVRGAQRGEDAAERVRVLLAAQAAVLDRGEQDPGVSVEVPARVAQVADPLAGPEAQLLTGALDDRDVGALQPADQVDPFRDREVPAHLAGVGALSLAGEQVDVGGAAGRADRELGLLGPVV